MSDAEDPIDELYGHESNHWVRDDPATLGFMAKVVRQLRVQIKDYEAKTDGFEDLRQSLQAASAKIAELIAETTDLRARVSGLERAMAQRPSDLPLYVVGSVQSPPLPPMGGGLQQ